MTRLGIIGWPLGHSLSPKLHNHLLRLHAIDDSYEAWPTQPEQLDDFMRRFREEPLLGASVTIPHKQTVMPFLDEISPLAQAVGAVNTLFWKNGTLCGDNTDVQGLVAPLRSLETRPDSAIVLGAGGAARAALAALREVGINTIKICNRTKSKAEELAAEFDVARIDWDERHDCAPGLIVNTTPLGMAGKFEDSTPWDFDKFPNHAVVYDIVYNPLHTKLLRDAARAGCKTITGLEMFLHQGLAQFKIWTGVEPDEKTARQLLLDTLAG